MVNGATAATAAVTITKRDRTFHTKTNHCDEYCMSHVHVKYAAIICSCNRVRSEKMREVQCTVNHFFIFFVGSFLDINTKKKTFNVIVT